MRLDVICLLALPVAFWYCARELISVREDDLLSGAGLYQAMMYRLGHGCWPWVFAFNDVLSCRLLEGPYDWLWR